MAGFVLERVLGRGGMGVVWLAREEGLARRVAVKVLAPDLAADEDFRRRFLTEMRLAASLDHPHVCPVYRAGEEDGVLYLALRYVPGEDLGSSLAQTGPLEPERALALVRDLAGALDAAHAHGLLHRDVKPENVLLDEERNAYLADFGLARSNAASRATVAGSLTGTVAYLAPERIEGGEATRASDLYAFACLVYCALAGTPPFVREHEAALLYAHVRDAPPSLAEHGLGRLDPVFARALAKQPVERYESCRELVTALGQALAGGEPEPGLHAWPATLPRPQTAFVGRERELTQAAEIVVDGARLVTLTGPGGTGKTRLGLELAARLASRFEDGVHWLLLAALRDVELLPAAIARELGEPESDPAQAIGERRLLLGLDNLEQLLPEAADVVADLLIACPNLTMIVTSRAPLHLRAEREVPVPALEEIEAVDLFVRRAEQNGFPTEPGDPDVCEIVRRVDCLPLAVELAAARLRMMPPATLVARLDQRLRVLTGGPRDAPARQQTLSATLDWSHELLPPDEQRLFARLAVFVGGFSLEAAEAVSELDLDTMQGLLDASLLRRRDDSEEPRYSMLAVIQEYAAGKLAAAEDRDRVHQAHAAFFLELAEGSQAGSRGTEGTAWLDRLEAEHDNLRAALAWAEHARDGESLVRIALALRDFWGTHSHFRDAQRWLGEAQRDDLGASAAHRVPALVTASYMSWRLGDLDRAEELGQAALALAERENDSAGKGRALLPLGFVAQARDDLALAARCYDESLTLSREAGDAVAELTAINAGGNIEIERGDYERARKLFVAAKGIAEAGGSAQNLGIATLNVGMAEVLAGRRDEGRETLAEALRGFVEIGQRHGAAFTLMIYGVAAAADGDARDAAVLLGAADGLLEQVGVDLERAERGIYENAAESSRAALGPEEWQRAHDEGAALGFEEAVELARSPGSP
ncbi:MAG: protein kinase [Gaiellaceae bacterium]